jgi:uncharacterized protein YciI
MPKPTIRKAIERKPIHRDPMSKLTNSQRIVLSGAAPRADGAATLPERMTEKAAQKLAATLSEKGLVREVRAKADMPVWRRNEEGRACALIVTKLGREANKGQEQSPSLSVSEVADNAAASTATVPEATAPRDGTKIAKVIGLLQRDDGATLDEVIAATGWLPHTSRAAFTGLRKRGYAIERRPRASGGKGYVIVATAQALSA